ncbi:MAG: hypothetical protein Ct9H90mP26_1800 [Methanobacteriota archaeon]|nr:MAG: hypothetical protein Ct9H90mP26_1800 [Euryarchaeota archaeon]
MKGGRLPKKKKLEPPQDDSLFVLPDWNGEGIIRPVGSSLITRGTDSVFLASERVGVGLTLVRSSTKSKI